jgi:sporulation protein YlmC with PRC-barrel domain
MSKKADYVRTSHREAPLAVKLKALLKRDVVTLAEGRNLGRPADIVIDRERHVASLVVLARGNVPDATLFVSAEDVRSFDTDTLAIESLDSLKIAATDPAAMALLAPGRDFRDHPLIDARGTKVGKVVQIRLDERGRVVEYRARRGPLGWLKPATKIEPAELRAAEGEIAVEPRELPGASDDEATRTREDAEGSS